MLQIQAAFETSTDSSKIIGWWKSDDPVFEPGHICLQPRGERCVQLGTWDAGAGTSGPLRLSGEGERDDTVGLERSGCQDVAHGSSQTLGVSAHNTEI